MKPRRMRSLLAIAAFVIGMPATADQTSKPEMIAGHVARRDAHGHLLPWIAWRTALDREMRFYESAPNDHGYPVFVTTTFVDGHWQPMPERNDTIPATQNAMGIVSYLKYVAYRGGHDPKALAIARQMGDYLLAESLTPDAGKYPRFPHSTGRRDQFPLPPDSGSQADHPYEIEPDKGGLVGYALLRLADATRDSKYFDQALHSARVLAVNQQPGDAMHSPWPFRADHRSGNPRGPISSDMTYVLRLYDELLARGYTEFRPKRAALWQWIKTKQIPSAKTDGARFAQFFEDHDSPGNRNAWAPLNLARYLLEQRQALDPQWREDSASLIAFVQKHFTHQEFAVTVCHEQDEDHDAWGGVNSTYGAVLALYARAVHSAALAQQAREALNFTEYAIDQHGRPRDLVKHDAPGGWQEDAHTDVIHNYMDALAAFPAWADEGPP
jgi:hypothetical protein